MSLGLLTTLLALISSIFPMTLGTVYFTMVFFFSIGIGSVPSETLAFFSDFDFELSLDLSDLPFQ